MSSPSIEESFEDDDIEVDVEECSDGETATRTKPKSHQRQSPAISDCGSDAADIDRDSPDIMPEKTAAKTKILCNCDELLTTECHLETKDLWDKFHDLGTEMIITKTGRYVVFSFVFKYHCYGITADDDKPVKLAQSKMYNDLIQP